MEPIHDKHASVGKEHINTCDIIIPTFKKEQSLNRTLEALHNQMVPEHWAIRIIVCDDGAPSSVQNIVGRYGWTGSWNQPLVLPLPHLGRAGARNAGIQNATADVILFLADDIILLPGSLQAHIKFHEDNSDIYAAALGWVMWDPCIHPTPFMEWMTHGGQQNNYDALLGEDSCDPGSFFYGSHVSVKRELIIHEQFAESFTEYGWEDLELGSRLGAKGMRLFPLQEASALHSHWYGADELLMRQRVIGAQRYQVNTNARRMARHALYHYSGARWLCRMVMKIMGNKVNIPEFFQWVIAGEFWYGVHHANTLLKRKNS